LGVFSPRQGPESWRLEVAPRESTGKSRTTLPSA